ncbi:hypothetical protein FE782_19365 [Paenibacillus antri]|uniref:Zinc finger CGNR domain-containing protein n=1 Tax=Paenibacillus antri TaxID=2582848 RepID=A0A5R9G821_9BACL|nr:ABATE domain-containing protein [Paenibacillus antri]TLS50526.1 hypothetical protein FE782_19365 [Paenibacillus antri]
MEEDAGAGEAQHRFSFLGGALPLDYCNTVDWHSSPDPMERLHRYEDLVDWGMAAGTISSEEGAAIRERVAARSDEAANAYREAIELRESLFRLFTAVAREETPDDGDLARLNDRWERTQRRLEIRYENDAFRLDWRVGDLEESPDLLRLLDPVVRAAVELLLSPKSRDVRRCEGPPGCGWLFLDHTKNHSRRWCSMRECGNREKMRRFHEKKKSRRENDG